MLRVSQTWVWFLIRLCDYYYSPPLIPDKNEGSIKFLLTVFWKFTCIDSDQFVHDCELWCCSRTTHTTRAGKYTNLKIHLVFISFNRLRGTYNSTSCRSRVSASPTRTLQIIEISSWGCDKFINFMDNLPSIDRCQKKFMAQSNNLCARSITTLLMNLHVINSGLLLL